MRQSSIPLESRVNQMLRRARPATIFKMPHHRTYKRQHHTVTAADGWKLALYHYSPENAGTSLGPTLLVHGLGANRYNMAPPVHEISIAEFLRARGHDVWVAELRGAGRSKPTWPRKSYNFNDLVFQDAPAFIEHVLKETGASRLNWVGHSLGGMVAYGTMINGRQELIRSVVTVGSPIISGKQHPLVDAVFPLRGVLKLPIWTPYRIAGFAGGTFPRLANQLFIGLFLGNASLIDARDVKALAPKALHSVPTALIDQFASWYDEARKEAKVGRRVDYWQNLDKIERPTLLVAGSGDRIVPEYMVREVYDNLGSERKELLLCSKANGFEGDYGHIDLLLARSARYEIYPRIAEWLEFPVPGDS